MAGSARPLSINDALEEAHKFHVAMQNGDREAMTKAESLYDFTINIEPLDPTIQYVYGTFLLETGKIGLAINLLKNSVAQKSDFSPAWNNLGIALMKRGRYKEARAAYLKALELSGPDVSAMINLGTCCLDDGDPEQSLKWFEFAAELDPDNTEIAWNKAQLLLSMKRYGEGWDGYDIGGVVEKKKRAPRSYAIAGEPDHPFWHGEPGKHVVIWGEQGVGDEVMFASCLPDAIAQCSRVTFDCHPRLFNIFERSFPTIKCYPTRKDTEVKWEWPKGTPPIDARLAIGSLPRLFRRTPESFPGTPYLKADPRFIGRYQDKSKCRVGIAWIGGTHLTKQDRRSIPLDMWGPILSVTGVEFVSLQYTRDAREQSDAAASMFNATILHDQEMIDDLDLQFGCIAGLDFLITVTMSICDFAGALGTECWTIVPNMPMWRFGIHEDGREWYGQERLFRQPKSGDWMEPINRIAANLKERVGA